MKKETNPKVTRSIRFNPIDLLLAKKKGLDVSAICREALKNEVTKLTHADFKK